MTRLRVTVRGAVQGVGFRYGLRREADRRGVTGWVRNAPDGSVEAELEGPEERVEALVAWCRAGPPHARVQDVAVEDRDPGGGQGFAVR